MIKSPLLAFSLLFFVAFYARAQAVRESSVSGDIEKEVLAAMREGKIPGLSIVLIKDSSVTIKSYGYSNIAARTPVSSGTLFQLGSCSKAFTAMAVLRLAATGAINLQASVSQYLPWFHARYKDSLVNITLLQLLHHTSGIRWQTISSIPQSDADDALERTVRALANTDLHNLPGEKYEYATVNYDILALIVQHVTGQPFENYLSQNVLKPLSLHHTTIGQPADSSLMATGYKIGFFEPRAYVAPVFRGNNAAGYIISNAGDMARWLELQMGTGDSGFSGLAKSTHRRDETVSLHDMSSYAMGWNISLSGNGEIYHEGLNPNFTAFIGFRPDRKIGVVVLANSNSGFTPVIGSRILKLLAGEKIERKFAPDDGNDKVFTILSFLLFGYILVVAAFLVMVMMDILKGRRSYEPVTYKKVWKIIQVLLILLPFGAGLYLLPAALAGFTWKSMIVWSPVSLVVSVVLALTSMGISYFAYCLSALFPEKNKFKRLAPPLLLVSVLSGLSNMAVIILVTSALNTGVELKYLVFYYLLTFAVYLSGRKYVQTSLIRITRELIYDLRMRLIEKIFSTSYQKFEKIDRGRVYTSLNDDVGTVGESINMFVRVVTSTVTALGCFLYLASLAFWATALTIVLVGSISVICYYASKSTNVYFEEARDSQNVFMNLINGMIDGYKEISLRRNKKLEYKEDVASSAREYRDKIATADIRLVNAFLIGESLLVALLGIVAFGIPKWFPAIPVYTIMSFIIVLLYLIGPVNGILNAVPGIMRLNISWKRIQQFLREIPANLDLNLVPPAADPVVENIRITGALFQYGHKSDQETFEIGPINFEARHGEVIFIIGGNGSGKTTFAKLLTGLYEPAEGEILINGKKVSGAQLSEYFSVVFSPSYLFGKLYDIDETGKAEDIKKYLKLMSLEGKVEITKNKYSSINLSGGQRKRLALLQCYLENAPIYLFDEWAADQDPGYRNYFYRTLIPEMRKMGKIVIAITHDDHYFDVADRIYKMRQGQLEVFNNDYSLTTLISTEQGFVNQ